MNIQWKLSRLQVNIENTVFTVILIKITLFRLIIYIYKLIIFTELFFLWIHFIFAVLEKLQTLLQLQFLNEWRVQIASIHSTDYFLLIHSSIKIASIN